MASENDFQQLQFSEVTDTRQKVDGFTLFGTGNPQDVVNAANKPGQRDQESLQHKPKCNLRKSMAWDSAFFTSPGVLDPEELFQTLKFRDMGNSFDILGLGEQKVRPLESQELQERSGGNGICNLRKSLAWDSAFFTSSGVLDPEELSMINKGLDKSGSNVLPGIEEFWRSVESNSTIDSDGSSLTSLEIDLFEDKRASAHKSTKMSNIATSSSILRRGGMQNIHPSKELDASSRVRIKPMVTSRGKSLTTHGLEKGKRKASVLPQAQACHAAGTREYNPKCAAAIGDVSGELHLSSSLKPPKISKPASRIANTPTKRASSLGTNHAKLENRAAKATSGQCFTVSRKPSFGDSCSVLHSSIPSPQSSSLRFPTVTNEATISSPPYSRFCGSASNTIAKSPLNSSKRPDSTRVNLVANGSTSRSPLKFTTSNTELENSNHPTRLLSVSKSSSCTSPASSIDGCSESSSTSINLGSNSSKASLNTTCRGVSFDSDAFQASNVESHQHDQPYAECESRETSSPNHCLQKILAGSTSIPSDVSRNIKPSGLRRPTPKIGFFDAENSKVLMMNGGQQFHSGVPSTFSKTGNGKLQPPRTLKGTGNMKPGSKQTGVPSPVLCIRRSSPSLSHRMSSKYCLKTKKGGKEGHDAAELELGSSSKAEEEGTQGFMKNKIGTKCEDQGCLKANKQSSKKNASMHSPTNNLHILYESGKENLFVIENQVDCLSRHVGAIDLSNDMVIEL